MSEYLAKRFHEAYERLAPEMGYRTRLASAVPWDEVPENNKALMIATCTEVISPLYTWTDDPPTEPGWYWWQGSEQASEVVFVLHYDDQSGPLVFRDPVDRSWQFVSKQSGSQWAGPIPLPGEPE